ncbi:female sterile (2) ltoPP43 [Lycorma delicatula]|uniref:female sterile (2) ltoPP43 n=1 Tax=Lycorma delicatula TaxID=130591 RepID=UPI003F51A3A1
MAVVRVKRRSDEEPLDILLLACKKRKTVENISKTSVFQFAATVNDQEDASLHFTHPFKSDAEKTVKRENKNIEEIKNKLRSEHELYSKNSRYKVVSCYRSINEDDLMAESDEAGNSSDKKGLTVLDVESKSEVKEDDDTRIASDNPQSAYVYDLYYTTDNADLNDLQLEHIQSVHCVGTELVLDSYRDPRRIDSDDNMDDDDDSNDENNWRNDYPDEEDNISGGDDRDYEGEDDERRLAMRMGDFRLGDDNDDDEDDLSSEDGDIYSGDLSPSDICNFGKRYARYKAKVNRDDYDSSCSINSDAST